MSEPLVSVIVPVYNAEKTLLKCVESITRQTYQKLEILLIDDGSTDDSAYRCQEFALADNRIKYVYKSNGGASSARNRGVFDATGKYLIFVDSDDWIEECTIEKLVTEAEASGVDCVIPRMRIVIYDSEGKLVETRYDKDEMPLLIRSEDIGEKFNTCMQMGFLYSASGRLYKSEFLKKGTISFFEDIKLLEDFCFNLLCIDKGASISHINYISYNFFVPNIYEYSAKRHYEDYYKGIMRVHGLIDRICINKNIPHEAIYNDFLLWYWCKAIQVANKQESQFRKRCSFQRKVALEVKREKLLDKYTKGLIDRSEKELFRTGSILLYYTIKLVQMLKHRYAQI